MERKKPLQKSFSEADRTSKTPQKKFGRNKSYQDPRHAKPNTTPRPLQDKPPLPISTNAKNKLKAFQFNGNSDVTKKTNEPVINLVSSEGKENDTMDGVAFTETNNSASEEKTIEKSNRGFPSTPAGRLALPDLIRMGDIQREEKDASPEDRIEWDQRTDSPVGIRRAKKRARSSSPISSPAAKAAAYFNSRGESLNAQIDPGSELWGRYSLNGSNAPTPQGPPISALANFTFTSSPQPSKINTPKSGMFRRTNSCGTLFPKRRRTGGNDNEDVFTESVSIGPSKLCVLIERVQEELTRPKSSSAEALQQSLESSSPPRPKHAEQVLYTPSERPRQDRSPAQSDGSDYGDFDEDDLDDSILTALTQTAEPVISYERNTSSSTMSRNLIPPDSRQIKSEAALPQNGHLAQASNSRAQGNNPTGDQIIPQARLPSAKLAGERETKAKIVPQVLPKPPTSHTKVEVDDEFDDSDEELFAAGLDEMVASFRPNERSEPVSVEVKLPPVVDLARKRIVVEDSQASEDEFGDDMLDADLEIANLVATQSVRQTSNSAMPSTQKLKTIQRYLVTSVVESEYVSPHGRAVKEKILFLEIEKTNVTKTVNLRGFWRDTPVLANAYVHVLGVFESNGRCIIDDEKHMLILHPDHLISSTVVGDSFGCIRRAVLQDRIKATSDSTPPLVYGTILHEIFQAALLSNRWDTQWLHEIIADIAARHIEDLYTIKLTISQAIDYLRSKMPELQSWAELFVSSKPNTSALVVAGNGMTANMCVSKLLDVEEHVWSPKYGLKGNIDATVQVAMQERAKGSKPRNLTVPFEIKTGKNPSASHRAQTALYSLLISDRYDIEIAYGILYYMETSETIRIPSIRHELRHMIMQRNELACFVRERHATLPPMLKKENLCNRCYAKTSCFIYHKLVDDGTGETSGMKGKFDEVVKHLTPAHKDFFLKWDDLLTKEEKESMKYRRELWTMLSSEREKLGRCFSNVVIEPGSAFVDENSPKINRYNYTMVKKNAAKGFSFLDSQIIVGEPVVISDEEGHFALANGYVTNVKKRRITVAVDRRLHNARIRGPDFDEVDNQVFASIMDVEAAPGQTTGKLANEKEVLYRLDKDEFSNGLSSIRNNLIQIMADGPFGSSKIRSLVVDLKAPRFKQQSTAYTITDQSSINVDQRRAIDKVMSAEDYALVLGMPGTGKTTTIAHIIRALVSQGKSVLLTSYTHSAVDNILLKLEDDRIPILRLGSAAKIHSKVREFATLGVTPKKTTEELEQAWLHTPVVATTCLGINHAVFSQRTFDYCIVDEASQITLPVCIGPIRLANTFILVGDHNQLPPLVVNEEARIGGLDISLFKHLSDKHPSSVVYLEHQYRMCEDVMALSNALIYEGRLKCGSQQVAQSRINIPNMDALARHHFNPSTLSRSARSICLAPTPSRCWLRDMLDPATRVSFLNTDPLLPLSREQDKGNRIINPTEARICTQLVEALLSVGVAAQDIGVMTHYRSQLSLLRDDMKAHPDVEMHTADRFQGRDKEVIILSLVRSNDEGKIGELLKDWRRINVAFTRAKTKLLVVGSRETLRGSGEEEMVGRFVGLMEEKGWVYNLPAEALESHHFDEGATQMSTLAPAVATQGRVTRTEDEQVIVEGNERRRVSTDTGKKAAVSVVGSNVSRQVLGKGSENSGLRQPKKRIMGNKPFKMPQRSVLMDIYNEEAL